VARVHPEEVRGTAVASGTAVPSAPRRRAAPGRAVGAVPVRSSRGAGPARSRTIAAGGEARRVPGQLAQDRVTVGVAAGGRAMVEMVAARIVGRVGQRRGGPARRPGRVASRLLLRLGPGSPGPGRTTGSPGPGVALRLGPGVVPAGVALRLGPGSPGPGRTTGDLRPGVAPRPGVALRLGHRVVPAGVALRPGPGVVPRPGGPDRQGRDGVAPGPGRGGPGLGCGGRGRERSGRLGGMVVAWRQVAGLSRRLAGPRRARASLRC
jgi:hypothetical protein